MSIIQAKIDATIARLTEKSRAHFEAKLAEYQVAVARALCEKEGEMRSQNLDAKFHFNFCVALPYSTEKGPLFPPLPTMPALPIYSLRVSARKPAGFYYEADE